MLTFCVLFSLASFCLVTNILFIPFFLYLFTQFRQWWWSRINWLVRPSDKTLHWSAPQKRFQSQLTFGCAHHQKMTQSLLRVSQKLYRFLCVDLFFEYYQSRVNVNSTWLKLIQSIREDSQRGILLRESRKYLTLFSSNLVSNRWKKRESEIHQRMNLFFNFILCCCFLFRYISRGKENRQTSRAHCEEQTAS